MKIHRDTIENLLNHYPSLRSRHDDVLLACARELSDEVSRRVLRAHEALGKIDPDNEPAWEAAREELENAEAAFLEQHSGTEISL